MPKVAAPASRSLLSRLPPPLAATFALSEASEKTRASRTSDKSPPALPLTEEEALLAQRLKGYLAEHPRCCSRAAFEAETRTAALSEAGASGPEEVGAIEEVGPGLPFVSPLLPPLAVDGWMELEADEDGTDADGAAVGPAPAWLRSRGRPSFRARLSSAVAWTTTLTIVVAVVGTAMVALIGSQRSLALAEGALARIVDVGRAVGLIHA